MAVTKTATKKVATKAAENTAETVAAPAKKTVAKTTCAKKSVAKSAEYINAESVGFRAGDVYQALASAGKSLTVAEIAKVAGITNNEVLLGLGWLFKEGKVKGENVADISLA